MPRADIDELLATFIPLPPLAKQQRIAAILAEQMAAVEAARAAAQSRLDTADSLAAAYLRDVFESDEAQGWETVALGDIALQIQNGIYKKAEFYGHGHPFLRMYNIQNTSWYLNLNEIAQVALDKRELEAYQLSVGDLLVSRVNSFELVGKCGYVSSEAEGFVFENMLIRLRLTSEVEPMFITQQMAARQIKDQIQAVAKRAIGQASINSTDLRSISIALPPIQKQQVIANLLNEQTTEIDRARAALQHQLGLINRLPAAILRRAFRGEL